MVRKEEYKKRQEQLLKQIGATYRQAALQQGLDHKELARRSGFKDLAKGVRRIKRLMESGVRRDKCLNRLLPEILGIEPELVRLRQRMKEEWEAYQKVLKEEGDLLAEHLALILEQADRICADAKLQYTLISENAAVGMLYIRGGYLPLGTLLDFWKADRFTAVCSLCQGQVYLYSAVGSPLSGTGQMIGLCVQCKRRQCASPLDVQTAVGLCQHLLFKSFQDRIQQGEFLRLADLVACLHSWNTAGIP